MTGHRAHLTGEAARRLTADTEPWMSCDECFEAIDGYLDALLAGTGRISPQLRAHLRGCGACEEEARSLLRLVAGEHGTSADGAVALLERDLGGTDP